MTALQATLKQMSIQPLWSQYCAQTLALATDNAPG
jgi:hypothetical protein